MQGDHSSTSGVSGRYAQALFELAQEAGSVDAVGRDLVKLETVIKASADLRRVMTSPVIAQSDQKSAIAAIVQKAGIKGLLANFIHFIASKRRLEALEGVVVGFRQLQAKANNTHAAQIVSAQELSNSQLSEIRKTLEVYAGGQVNLDASVDAGIIGGLIVKLGSRMVDASLKTKLNSLRIAMKEA